MGHVCRWIGSMSTVDNDYQQDRNRLFPVEDECMLSLSNVLWMVREQLRRMINRQGCSLFLD